MLKIVVALLACISESIAANAGHPVYGVPNASAKFTETNSEPYEAIAPADTAFHRHSTANGIQAFEKQLVARGQEIFATNSNAYPSLLGYSAPSFVLETAANAGHPVYGVPKEPAKLSETISEPYGAVDPADTTFHRHSSAGSGIQENEKQLVDHNYNEFQRRPEIFAVNPNAYSSLPAYSTPSSVQEPGTNAGYPIYGVPNAPGKLTATNRESYGTVSSADVAFHRNPAAGSGIQTSEKQLVARNYNEFQRGQGIFAANPNAYTSLPAYSAPSSERELGANAGNPVYGVPNTPAKLTGINREPYVTVSFADVAFHRNPVAGSGIQANEKQLVARNYNELQRGQGIFSANPNAYTALPAYSAPSSEREIGANAGPPVYGVPNAPAKLSGINREPYETVPSADVAFHRNPAAGSGIQANEKQLVAGNYNEFQRGPEMFAVNPNAYPSLISYSTPISVREPAANAGHPISGVPKDPAKLTETTSIPYGAVSSADAAYHRLSTATSGIQANEKQLIIQNYNDFRKVPEILAVNPNSYSSSIAYPAPSFPREHVKQMTSQNILQTAENLFTLAKPVSYPKLKAKEDFETSSPQTPVIYSPPVIKDVPGTLTASSKQVAARNYNGNSETQSLTAGIAYSNSISTSSPTRIEAKSSEKITTHKQKVVAGSSLESETPIIGNTLPVPNHSSTILPIAANLVVSPNFNGFAANNLAAYSLPLKYHTPGAILGQNYNANPLLTGFTHSAAAWPPYISSGYRTVTGQTYPGYTYPYHSAPLSVGYSNHIAGYNSAAYSSHPIIGYYSPSAYNRPYSTAYSARIDSYIRW